MWAIVSVAFEAALLSVVGFALLAWAKEPMGVSLREMLALNFTCVLVASIFALFIDSHGSPPATAYVIAALEPLVLAAVVATRGRRGRTN